MIRVHFQCAEDGHTELKEVPQCPAVGEYVWTNGQRVVLGVFWTYSKDFDAVVNLSESGKKR